MKNLLRVLVAIVPADARTYGGDHFRAADIEIVGEVQDDAELVSAVERTRPDFLDRCARKFNRCRKCVIRFLQSYPQMKVIAVFFGSQQLHVFIGPR